MYHGLAGVWFMRSSNKMDEVFQLFGAGPCTSSMVSGADMILSLQEDATNNWWIRTEYRFKGKNHLGYRQHVHKLTSNIFFPGQEKPEVEEDWDKRYDLIQHIHKYNNIPVMELECHTLRHLYI